MQEFNDITISAEDVARIKYVLSDRTMPRALSELVIATILKLDPEARGGIIAPHRIHLFTTAKKQTDPFPAVIEMNVSGWIAPGKNGSRLATVEEVEAFKRVRSKLKDGSMANSSVKYTRRPAKSRMVPSEGNDKEL